MEQWINEKCKTCILGTKDGWCILKDGAEENCKENEFERYRERKQQHN